MKIFRFLPIAFAIVLGLSSCGDENSAIGSSIVDTNIEIVVDSSFQELITVESVPNDSVVGRTITPVSYTHLDVYKRQVRLLCSRALLR